jgi:TM2 domain-containing membrane protein YozV
MTTTVDARHPGVAGVLSLIIPGVGQIYNGDFLRGAFWLVVTPGLWIGSGGLFGWIFHLIAAYTAHQRAKDKNAGFA